MLLECKVDCSVNGFTLTHVTVDAFDVVGIAKTQTPDDNPLLMMKDGENFLVLNHSYEDLCVWKANECDDFDNYEDENEPWRPW